MKRNSRLSLALHTLSHMAGDKITVQTSTAIAEHAGTNPVVVRRVLGQLRKAGLLISEKGHAGGWRLAREPQNITLADVYLALDESLIANNEILDANACSIEYVLQTKISGILKEAEDSLIKRLSAILISDIGNL